MDRAGGGTVQFDIKTLSTDPTYDFLNNILHNNTDDDFSFFTSSDGSSSPYDTININCKYSSFEDCTKIDNKFITILSLNVQSLNAKFSEIKDIICEMDILGNAPDVICLQELWQFPVDTSFKLNGYQDLQYRLRADHIQGGGVGIYIRNGLNFVIDPVLSIFHDRIFETLFIEILTGNKKVYIGSVYRPNNHPTLSSGEIFDISMDLLTNILNNINEKNTTAFIFGDFNLDVLKYSKCTQVTNYIDLLFSQGFIQTVTRPTRCSRNTATIIDHCITNSTYLSHESNIITSLISDHFPIFYTLKNNTKDKHQKFIQSRNFSEDNFKKFKESLKGIDWNFIYSSNDTQEAYNYFLETFLALYEIYFPLKKTRFNINFHKADPWFTSGLLRSRREKIRLDKLAAKTRTDIDILKYKDYRNLYNKLVRKAKSMYFSDELSKNQSNMKRTWQLIRSAINKKPKNKSENIPGIFYENSLINQPSKIAKAFNDFFSTAPEKIVNLINPTDNPDITPPMDLNQDHLLNKPIFQSADLQIGHEEIYNALKLLEPKKSQDFNGISMQFVKTCFNEIISPLHHIFNLSIQNGVVPDQMKIAKIVPIYKTGDPRNMDNYRHIALLSNFSKILEKNYVSTFDIFS